MHSKPESQNLVYACPFKRFLRRHLYFRLTCFTFACAEVIAFFLCFLLLSGSPFLAFFLAGICLSGFSYFLLKMYFDAKRPEQLIELKDIYLERCSLHRIDKVESLWNLAKELDAHTSKLPSIAKKLCKKITFEIQELLLQESIHQHTSAIQENPTSLQLHASLAHACLLLSKLYGPVSITKQKNAAQKTLEELSILEHYAPKDPWVQAEKATIYNLLHMPEKEILSYEELLAIAPENNKVLYTLGSLYFQQKMYAKGLQVYEKLKNEDPQQAKILIESYICSFQLD